MGRDRIEARDVKPGMIVWNPYGGPNGRLDVREVAERGGTMEFTLPDGRVGRFRPRTTLRLDPASRQPGEVPDVRITHPVPGDRSPTWTVECLAPCGTVISRHQSEPAALRARTGHIGRAHADAGGEMLR